MYRSSILLHFSFQCVVPAFSARGWLVFLQVLLFFTVATYSAETGYGVVDTLFNPILSDYFGFTEKEISFYFLGLMVIFTASSLLL